MRENGIHVITRKVKKVHYEKDEENWLVIIKIGGEYIDRR